MSISKSPVCYFQALRAINYSQRIDLYKILLSARGPEI